MDLSTHNLNTLFAQLGLPDDDAAIAQFIRDHAPLPKEQPIYEASCFSDAQAAFLVQALDEDSDWAELIDQLASALRIGA